MVDFSSLNPAQQEAVMDDSHHLRIIAGAGSGKTRVLTMRIAHLIEDENVAPYHILAITFTNKAAKEMKERILKMLGDDKNNVWISTIHSLCMRILREDIGALGYPKNFTIIDQDDQHAILKEAYKEYGIEKKNLGYSTMLAYISNNKSERVTATRALELASGDYNEVKKAQVYGYYLDRLRSIYALDFDDLIFWTVDLFSKEAEIKEKWSRRFHYIHVDEFQDIDKTQYKLIRQLSCIHNNLYVVGDPDQTIYTWRGADVNIIIDFERDYPGTKTIILNENYRSTNNILNAANSLIKNNQLRVDKDLFTRRGDGLKITHNSLDSDESEAYYVRREILKLHEDGVNYKDIAILYRSNYLSRNVEKVLMEARVPYIIFGGIRFYERAEVKDILCYLRMVTTADDLAFKRIINAPRRGIGPKTLDQILEIAKANDISMYEVIKQGLYAKNKEVFKNFVKMIESWREMNEAGNLELLLQHVLDDSGYREYLTKENETERLENVKSLVDDIAEYQQTYPESSLDEYLQMISLYTDKASDKDSDSVNLMTIHAAKGLEFDTVFVIGMSEGVFPGERAMSEGLKGLEEERRLAYVAYTRAKRILYLTDGKSFSFVLQSSKTTSRFVNEINEKYIEHVNRRVEVKPTFVSSVSDTTLTTRKDSATASSSKIKKGDRVIHALFGEGIVVNDSGNILSIAFMHPHGIKKIAKGHQSIKKK